MNNIICDTNIWYDIANGKIKPEQIRNIRLIGTAINIIEIASAENLTKDIYLVQKTIKALQNFHHVIVSTNPLDHIISIFNSSFISNDDSILNLLNEFDSFQEIDDFNDLSADTWNKVKEKISKIDSNEQYITKVVNDVLDKSQEFIKRNHLKKSHMLKTFTDSWKPFFILLISNYAKSKYNYEFIINENDIRWNRLEFFLSVWDEYFKHLDIQPGRRFHDNDWHDLFNLIYVQPEYKYWTCEKRSWAKIIREHERLKSYLYNK